MYCYDIFDFMFHVVLCYFMLRYVKLCHGIVLHVMLWYGNVIVCHVMLC